MYATTSAVMRRRRPVLRIAGIFRINGRQAITDAWQGLDQLAFERCVDAAPQLVDVRTQHVAIGRIVAPQRVFEPVARDRGRAGLHQHFQQLATGRKQVQSAARTRSEEHTSELQSLMRISYAVFCLKKKKTPFYCASPNHM